MILASSFVRPPRLIYARLRWAAVAPTVWMLRFAKRLPVWLCRSSSHPFRRDKTETWRRVNASLVAARIRALLQVDVRELLKNSSAPVLCLVGSDDGVVPYDNVQQMVRARPSTQVRMIEGHHFAIYTNPNAAAGAIEAFIVERE